MNNLKVSSGPTMTEILNFQQLVVDAPEHVTFPVFSHFSDHVYVREFHMNAGELVVGKAHRTRHLNMLIKGTCTVWTPEGKYELDAADRPCIFESKAGVKKIVYAKSDIIWVTVHPTDETDLAKLEHEIIEPEEQLSLFPYLNDIAIEQEDLEVLT